jgi:hypothetical protein
VGTMTVADDVVESNRLTRGMHWLDVGCHVAQSRAATWHPGFGQYGLCQKFLESGGFEPRTSPPQTPSQRPSDQWPPFVLVM